MESEDRALKGTEYTPAIWILLYVMAAAGIVLLSVDAWFAFHAQPFSWRKPVDMGFEILLMPIPILMGLAFRKTLRSELSKSLLSERTYRICDFWIAQSLLYAYLCLAITRN